MASFGARTTRFLEWFRQYPGSFFHSSLSIEDFRSRDAGRGIIATEDIPQDTELFKVPRHAVLTTENSSLSRTSPTLFDDFEHKLRTTNKDTRNYENADPTDADELEEKLDPWLKLIITLIYEKLLGSASPWSPYLDVLPSTFNTLMSWTEEELTELQASDVRQKIGKQEADEMFRMKLIPIIRSHEHVFSPRGLCITDEDLVALAHRMGSVIMAYAFDLEKDDDYDENAEQEGWDGWVEDREGQMLGMVPMADILNADAEFNAHLNHGTEELTMTSLREIKKGEEVLNYYGPLPNSDLLRRYGYTSTKHRVHDVVELSWSLVTNAMKKCMGVGDEEFEEIVRPLDMEDFEDSFVLEWKPVEPDSSGRLPHEQRQFVDFPEGIESQYKAVMKAFKNSKSAIPPDPDFFWKVLERAIVEKKSGYPDDQGMNDEKLLETAEGRLKMAVEVRLGEKRLLAAALSYIDTKRKVRPPPGTQSEAKRKKRKTSR